MSRRLDAGFRRGGPREEGDLLFAIKDDLIHAGADWVDQEVAVDGNLITSRKPDDLPAFMRAVITALKN